MYLSTPFRLVSSIGLLLTLTMMPVSASADSLTPCAPGKSPQFVFGFAARSRSSIGVDARWSDTVGGQSRVMNVSAARANVQPCADDESQQAEAG